MEKNKYVMYAVILRHLSGIQKGIQAKHASDEFAETFADNEEFKQWRKSDKTVIYLEVDSTQLMRTAIEELKAAGVNIDTFKEYDLDDLTTAFIFLGDETVWNTDDYPDETFTVVLPYDTPKKEKRRIDIEAQYAANIQAYGMKAATIRKVKSRFRLASN